MTSKNSCILVVEDDVAISETLSIFLNYEGYEVHCARNVEQASLMLDEMEQPDLVLLDYMLGEKTAGAVAEKVREVYGEDSPVILLMTASENARDRGIEVSADIVLAKPFELDVLLRKIEEALSKGHSGFIGPDPVRSKAQSQDLHLR